MSKEAAEPDSARPDAHRLVASLPLALLIIAPDQTVSSVNPAAEQLFGLGARRLVGRSIADLVAFDEPLILERMKEGDAQVFARGSQVRIGNLPPRRLDVMIAPVAQSPGWQMLALHETVGVESLSDGTTGAGEGVTLRAPEVLAHEIKLASVAS